MREFDAIFTTDRPVIFAFHGYPMLIHRLTYRRTNHGNIHVRGYKEEGTTTTPFDMVMLNDLDRFHLVDRRDRPGARRSRGSALGSARRWSTRAPPPGGTPASSASTRPRSHVGVARPSGRRDGRIPVVTAADRPHGTAGSHRFGLPRRRARMSMSTRGAES